MTRLADVQEFIDHARHASGFEELRGLLGGISRGMGFDHFALMHHLDLRLWPERRIVALSDYPESWKALYIERQFQGSDPIVLAAQRTAVGFRWDELARLVPLNGAHRKRLELGRRAGIADGFTVPANIPGETCGSCTFTMEPGHELPEANLPMAQLVGPFAFQAARELIIAETGADAFRKEQRLTTRQLECVLWLGRGKTAWETGQILGISADTVNEYLDEARHRYGVARRVELVVHAAFRGELALTDMVSTIPH